MEWMCKYCSIDILATGSKIKTFMQRSGYSTKLLANSLGVSNQAVYKWLNGQALPSLENLYQMSKLFKVTMDDMVVDKECQEYVLPEIYVREGGKKEGIVIRPTEPVFCSLISASLSMKVVSKKYLLKNEE